jgi:4-amino-4-deoxy-L-arabinose transferase-like glycosyltransferase
MEHALKTPGKKIWAPWASSWNSVFVFVLGLSALRLAYLIWLSPFTLAEDEAHYWEWSRHLDWSYYSKGPGVAWVIAAATSVFGNVEWAVRLPAIIAAGVGSIAAALTARAIFEDKRTGFVAAVLYQCVPPFSVLGMIMTIDGPYLASWAVACYTAVMAAKTGKTRWLVATGLALAAGFIFKYTIVILPIGLIIAAVAGRKRVRFPVWAWLGATAAFALGLVPVLIWNAGQDWVTVRHLLGHLGLSGGDLPATQGKGGWHYAPLWTLEYLAMLLLVGPVGLLGDISAVKYWKASQGVRVLVAASLPILVFYLLVTFVAEAEGNWALGGFVALVPLAAGIVPGALDRGYIPIRALWRLSLITGAGTLLLVPAMPILATSRYLGQWIPVHRLTGLREVASSAQVRLDELREQTGLEPFLITEHYGRTSQLAFYMNGHPVVYAAGSMTPAGRRSQYDLWPETDLRNLDTIESLSGRPALIFGGRKDFWPQAFERVEDIGPLPGEPKNNRTTYLGYGFHGFDEPIQTP